jgi:MFS family permease
MGAGIERIREASASWLGPLLATMLIQTILALLNRVIPTLAPVLLPAAALDSAAVGYFDGLNTLGAMVFLVGGTPLIRRCGPIRALQIGLLLGAIGVALLTALRPEALVGASLLMGLAYGPSSPAGSDILLRHAPKAHQTLIFSIKQAAVPLGGILAGLLLPQLLTVAGWYVTVAVLFLSTLATVAAVQTVRTTIDANRNTAESVHIQAFLSRHNLVRPLKLLWLNPHLLRYTAASACFSCAQGAVFAFYVTFLVKACDFDLAAAGAIFAVFQVSGIFGRILLGWLCDRLGSGLPILRATGAASAATIATIALATPLWPWFLVATLAAVGGITISSWNGVNLAEVARAAPREQVSETTAGVAFINYIGFVIGPMSVAGLLAAVNDYRIALLTVGLTAAVGSLILMATNRGPPK